MECNQSVICGEIIRFGGLRYTPAGIPVIDFVVRHQSRQREAGIIRQVNCELPIVALGEPALTVSALSIGNNVKITGFFNRKSQSNQQLVLHVKEIIQI